MDVLSSGALKVSWVQGDLRRLFLSIFSVILTYSGEEWAYPSKEYACTR